MYLGSMALLWSYIRNQRYGEPFFSLENIKMYNAHSMLVYVFFYCKYISEFCERVKMWIYILPNSYLKKIYLFLWRFFLLF